MNKRKIAIITGGSLVLMALVAGYSIGFALPSFYPTEQLDALQTTLLNQVPLYKNMLIGIFVIIVLDFLVSYTLYRYFKEEQKNISAIAGILRVIYTLIFGIAAYYLSKNLSAQALSNQEINSNFVLFQVIWSAGLIVFGGHLLLIGFLMKLHQRIPKIFWYLAYVAGASYLIVHLLKLIAPALSITSTFEMILSLPMALGELSLAIWLIVKGGKTDTLKH